MVLYLLLLSVVGGSLCSSEYRIESLNVEGKHISTHGETSSIACHVIPNNAILWWEKDGKNVTNDKRTLLKQTSLGHAAVLTLTLRETKPSDIGIYTCRAVLPENRDIQDTKAFPLNVTLRGRVVRMESMRANIGDNAALSCDFQGYPLTNVAWKIGNSGLSELLPQNIETHNVNDSFISTKLHFHQVRPYENGSYLCTAEGPDGLFNATAHLYVLNKPNVTINTVKAVGARTLFVNWTASDGNEPIKQFFLQSRKNGTNEWVHYQQQVGAGNTSFLIRNLDKETAYQVSLSAKNVVGQSDPSIFESWVTTLSHDPEFVPEVTVKGTTSDSVSIGWSQPRPDVRDYVHYYQIILQNNDTMKETIHSAASMNAYMFTELKAMTTYRIKIAACSEYTKQCGPWSREENGTTLEGTPEPPENVTVLCRFDNISQTSFVLASWRPPRRTFGTIMHYKVVLIGTALFRNELGALENMTLGPKVKSAIVTSGRFENASPNTNYTVGVSVVTRQRHVGQEAKGTCVMPPTIPDKEKMSRFYWNKVETEGRWLLRLNLQRLSERNGAICCYMVYMVRLRPGQRSSELPSPEELPISSYQVVHSGQRGGAYIADAVDGKAWTSEVFIGDGKVSTANDSACKVCLAAPHRRRHELATSVATTEMPLAEIFGLNSPMTTSELSPDEYDLSTLPTLALRSSNDLDDELDRDTRSAKPADDTVIAFDGELDNNSNYTGFVEVVVFGENGTLIPAYSNYLMPLVPGPVAMSESVAPELAVALHVLIGLVLIVCILLIVLFVLHSYTKTVAEEQGIDMNFTNTLMHLCRNVGGRHVPVSSSPPDMPPIARAELPAAVAERHRDSDYGFQHEFELLPDRFPDRTTRASESRDNFYKNRYPDIKAYDQTRVRLTSIDNTPGSDYINANYVIGYKERKKFICAQGPMDNTVNEFWRLVWEQHLEMILMLTNLEEYSKTKCAQYWPDAGSGSRRFGELNVSHVRESRFADYLVRELRLKLGDSGEERRVVQYHYLVWKDFMAPENPAGILKFIKRVNEEYSLEKGPILVHCSAGVGRTGTLVALDSLLQQLREEDQVAIFNTVCDLRHQRNFLVQSLKQYIFIYRALQEVSQSGDTEIKLHQLKSHVEKVRMRENGKDKCLLEEEFERLLLLVDERNKSWSVGTTEENKAKNRNPELLPLDRNRVMLSPIPGKDHSTYINASFVEGYDNSESLIITQDPLPNTLSDFWRMISEHTVHTLVMLSELGDGPRKCIRYWPEPDDESVYDNIKVRYIQSESCPYYTRREFSVTNLKTDDCITTTQFQYNGWPTVEGEVPEVTRGMIELVDQTSESHTAALAGGSPGPMAIHCNWGAERSSMFVALNILVQQLRAERAIDVFAVARKLRSQRHMMLEAFPQYDFLHRAILNYAELHHMTENGAASSPL